MIRKINRTDDYEIKLEINNDHFLRTPRESQRTWMLNRLIKEYANELEHLNSVSGNLLTGSDRSISLDRAQSSLTDSEIMEDWQIPIMKAMAAFVAETRGDVLEIGMGRGIAADFIQSHSPRSHTLIECNDSIVANFPRWSSSYPGQDIQMIHGMWQDKWDEVPDCDGILFHTYPLTHEDFVEQVVQSSTFAEHFFKPAAEKLRDGGVLTYLTSENDSLGRAHQRSLLRVFRSFTVSLISDLEIPDNTQDACWLPQMVLVKAVK